jgi:serine/threonine-protein kinase
MGAVWVADHVDLDAPVAIKFQNASFAGKEAAGERFQREAKMAARLRNPHVVRIQDYGVADGVPFMAMELLEGESLRARLDREERATPREATRLLRQAAAGLDFAHAAGVVHRDVKPSNLFVAREGDGETLKILDFGIAKWTDVEGDPTASSVVLGSARYMSPEQARGEAVDRRTDIWSLGVVAYEMLTGDVPFRGANLPDTTTKICAGVFEKPSARLGASYACFDSVFERALALLPTKRPETATELAEAFARAAAEWKGSASGSVGRESDTATMRATVTAKIAGRARRGGALGLGLIALAAVGGALVLRPWLSGGDSRAVVEPSKPSAAPPAAASVAPSAPPATAAVATPSAPAAAATASIPAQTPRSPIAPQPKSARKKPAEAPAPTPSRKTDPDFGLSLPGR